MIKAAPIVHRRLDPRSFEKRRGFRREKRRARRWVSQSVQRLRKSAKIMQGFGSRRLHHADTVGLPVS